MTTLGLDVGSTYIKGVLVDADGHEVGSARRSTPWQSLPHGRAEMAPDDLLAAVEAVLADLGADGRQVCGIGVSGMAEAGVLLTPDDQVVGPVVAWFDPRGAEDVADMPADLRAEFAGRTGLPLGPLATFTKLWHRSRHDGLVLADRQWLNVPEVVAWWLGGERRSEVSLAARTGLLDQDTGQVWPRAAEALGVTPRFLPTLATAGSVWGGASRHVPPSMAGAALTVAGHDHLVSSTASGVLDVETLYDSIGTAEALVRVLDGVLDRPARARLAGHGVNVVRHMLPGHGVMLAGTRSGLLMRRALQIVGVNDAVGRAAIDAEVMRLDPDRGDAEITVSGAANADGVLNVRADADGLSPALLFDATLRHGCEVLADVLASMAAENPPATRSVVAGGWASMQSVRRSRRAVLPEPRFSDHDEDTAYGAALVAAFAADPGADDLVAHLTRAVERHDAGLTGSVAGSTHPPSGGTPR
ncbi:MAG: carbohydrate kinase [Nocardioidaceae bacterium]|nr:carbohydrate kinase [Nocardioidaceae bacterium]NUS50875.1 carbohydrate kinase [Nocardioidaceae bacterium]